MVTQVMVLGGFTESHHDPGSPGQPAALSNNGRSHYFPGPSGDTKMVRLRLKRMGRTHSPYYRICAMDARSARDSKAIEYLGQYDPCNKDESKQINVNTERAQYWLSVGAQPSETVATILKKAGVDPTPGKKA